MKILIKWLQTTSNGLDTTAIKMSASSTNLDHLKGYQSEFNHRYLSIVLNGKVVFSINAVAAC